MFKDKVKNLKLVIIFIVLFSLAFVSVGFFAFKSDNSFFNGILSSIGLNGKINNNVLGDEVIEQYTLQYSDVEFESSTGTIIKVLNGSILNGKHVIIPETLNGSAVKIIAEYSFRGEKNNGLGTGNRIKGITLPVGLVEIGGNAFESNDLTTVKILKTYKVNRYAFARNKLTSIEIEDGVKEIEDGVFSRNKLTAVSIPNSVEFIGHSAFFGNEIVNLVIPDNITEIGSLAFGQNKITHLTLSSNIETIGVNPFSDNPLEQISLSSANPHFKVQDGMLFTKDGKKIISYASLNKTVVIPNGVETVDRDVFYNKGLTSIDIPNSITKINYRSFSKNSLTNVNIPNTLIVIDMNAFSNNPLENIYIEGHDLKLIEKMGGGTDYQLGVVNENLNIFVPNEAFQNYYEDPSWAYYKNNLHYDSIFKFALLPDGTYGVNGFFDDSFSGNIELVGDNAIPETYLGRPVTVISNDAFDARDKAFKITALELPNTITLIGRYAFRGNEIVTLTIPNSVEEILYDAFSMVSLSSLVLGNGLKLINVGAFREAKLTSLIIPDSVETIQGSAFQHSPLTSLVLGENVTHIGAFSFDSANLNVLIIPRKVVEIGNWAFGSSPIINLLIPDSVETIGERAFNMQSMKKLVIGTGLKNGSIGFNFRSDTNVLEEIIVSPDNTFLKSEQNMLYSKEGTILYMTANSNKADSFKVPSQVVELAGNALTGLETNEVIIHEDVLEISGQNAIMVRYRNTIKVKRFVPGDVNEITQVTNGLFLNNNFTKIIVPKAALDIYKAAPGWSKYADIIFPDTIDFDVEFDENQLIEKTYDGNNTANLVLGTHYSFTHELPEDLEISVSAIYETINSGENLEVTITISFTDTEDYSYIGEKVIKLNTGKINKRELTLMHVEDMEKYVREYDGTNRTGFDVSEYLYYDGLILDGNGEIFEDVYLDVEDIYFENKTVGVNKKIILLFGDISNENYFVSNVDTFALYGDIIPITIVVEWEDKDEFEFTGDVLYPKFSDSYVRYIIDGDDVQLTYNISTGSSVEVGNYVVTAVLTGDDSENYVLENSEKQFSITKASFEVVWDDESLNVDYNGQQHFASAYFLVGQRRVDINIESIENNGKVNAGSYDLTIVNENLQYDLTNITAVLVINKKTISVSSLNADAITKTFDGTTNVISEINEGVHYEINGVVDGDVVEVTFTAVYDSANAGNRKILISGIDTNNDNYELENSFIDINGIITKRDIQILPVSNHGKITKTYDGTTTVLQTLTENVHYEIDNAVQGAEFGFDLQAIYSDKNSGDRVINVTVSNFENDNYNLLNSSFELNGVIEKAQIKILWSNLVLIFDGSIKLPTYAISNPQVIVDGDNIELLLVVRNEQGDGDGISVGTHVAKLLFKTEESQSDTHDNYTIHLQESSYNITKTTYAVEWSNLTYTYDGQMKFAQAHITINGQQISLNDLIVGNGQTNASEHSISIPSEHANYDLSNNVNFLTIGKRTITIQSNADTVLTKTYDGNVSLVEQLETTDFVFNGLLEQDSLGFSFNAKYDSKEFGLNKKVIANDFEITNENYEISSDTLSIEFNGVINKKDITISAIDNSNDKITKIYDKTTEVFAGIVKGTHYSFSGIVSGEENFVELDSYDANYEHYNVAESVKIIVNGFSVKNQNYNLITDNFELQGEITPFGIEIHWSSKYYTYNGLEQRANAVLYDEDLFDGDEVVLNVALLNVSESINIGQYEMQAHLTVLSGTLNYYIINENYTYEIVAARFEAVWGNLVTTYNGQQQSPTAYIMVSGQRVDLLISGSGQTNAGIYDVVAQNVNPNFSITNPEKQFVINKLTVTLIKKSGVENISKTYDSTTSVLETNFNDYFEFSGVLQTDSVSILVSIATYDSKNFGQRIVTLSGLSLIEQDEDSKNYVLETQIFDLDGFINKKQITVSGIGEITKVYDGTTDVEVLNVGVNYEFEGLKGNDELSLFDYVAQFDSINAGDRTINVSELTIDNENYELTTESFVISATITVRYLEIEWQDTDLEFTNELQLPTAIIKNLSFVLEQDLSLVNSLIVSLKSGTDGKSVGEHYAIVAFANEVLNYELTNVETLYSIGMIQLEVHWENCDLTYNGANQKPVAYVWVSQGVRENLLVTVSQTEHKNAGTYQASARSQNENYSVSNAPFNFEISKALVDVNEQEIVLQKTYDGTNALPVGFEIVNETHYSLAGLVQGDVVTLSFGVGQFNSVNVGQTTITLTKIEIDNSNYYVDIESLTYNAIINKLGVSIRSTSETVEKVYDKQLDAFTYINSRHYEILGSVLGKVVTLTNFNATFNGVNAGQTTILVTALEIDDDNYYLLDDEFTVNATITRKAITVVWDNLSLPWTGSVQLPTAILNQSDVLQGDEELLQLSAVSLLSGYNGIDVGLHMAVVTITGDASLNYELQNGEQQFSIGQVTVSVQWEGDSFIYNSQEQLPKAFVIINGQRINLLVQSQTLGGAIFVGNHTAVAVNESDDFVIENETKQFVITKKEITVSIENLVVEKVYDATMSVVKDTINITKQNIVFVGVYGNDVVNLDFDEVRFVDSNVGSGKEVVFGSLEIDNNNYELVTQNISTFNNIITPKKITVVKSDNSQKFVKEYDGTVLVAGELQNSDYHFVGVELTDEMSIYLNSNLTKRYASKNSSDSIDVIFENLSINNENYMLTTTELILDGEITPIKVILEWNFTSVEFTGMINKPEPKIVNGNYLVEGDQPLDIIVVLISGDATNVGTHKVEARVDEDVVNYVLIGHEHTFVITNGEFYVEWEQDTLKFIYNGLKQVPTAFVMVAGVREGLIVETLLQSDGTNAGTYTAIARSENDNYQLINDSVVYEIEKIVVQLQMLNNQITKEYDGNVNYSHSLQPNVNYVLVGVLQQDENMVSINHNAIRFSTINVVQNDRIVVTNVVLTNAVNYVLDTQTIELIGSITPKQISISGVGVITKTYDGTVNDSTRLVKGINYMLSGDLVTDNVSLTSYNISFDTINAGSFKTVMVNSLILSNSNYVLQSDWFTLSGEITKKQITLIWSNLNLYFTGQMQIPVAQFNINDIVSFDRQTFEVVVDGQQFEVGSYVATARIVSHENYELTNASQSFEILSAMLEVVWQNVEFTYNGQLNVPSALVTINGVERTLQVAGEQINAGTYVATIIDEFNGNYTYSENEKEFVIKSKQISIVWGQTVLTYNGVEQFPQVSVETGVGNETLELVTYEFGGKTSKNVDKYMAHAVMLTENLNYKLVNDFVEFEIVAKQISIDIAGVVVKEYDRTEKATLTQQNFMFNLQEIYENDSVLVSSYIALFDGADAGVKDIVVTGIKISNANYVINNDTFTISGEITPKLVFIRLENNVSKLQGKSEKQIPFIAIGLVEGDQLIGSLSREEGEEVGAYRIVSGTLTNEFNPNYIFNYNGLTEFSYIIEEDTTWIIYAAVIAGVVVLTTIVSVVVITKRRRNRITEMLNREQLKSIFNNINIGRIRDLENRNNRNYDDDFDTRKK